MGGFPIVVPGALAGLSSGNGVNAKHPEWIARAMPYCHIDLLSMGGYQILRDAGPDLLFKRHKETVDVYADRRERMTYQNLIGSAIGWYNAAMFREEWVPTFKKDGNSLTSGPDDFYTRFLSNVDRAGTTFNSFLAELFGMQLKFQKPWVLTDKPNFDPTQFKTRAEQTAAGANDPYIVLYDPRNVINWDTDDQGNLTWAVVWTPIVKRVFKQKPVLVDRWTYYDRTTFTIYESVRPEGQTTPNDSDDKVNEIASGAHALSDFGRVPLRQLAIPDLFWLANRAYPQARDHLNMDNSYRHALFMANLPMAVVYGDYEEKPQASETALNVLPTGSRLEWLEPKGTSFAVSAERLSALVQEIYRQFYLQAQGRDNKATPAAASGYSKEMEWIPATDVCGKFAKWLTGHAELILRDVADARGDIQVTASVSGTDFTDRNLDSSIATLELLKDADIPSDTLEKESQIDVAMEAMKAKPDETLAKIRDEIESAPKKSERAIQQQLQAQDQFAQQLTTTLNRQQSREVLSDAA